MEDEDIAERRRMEAAQWFARLKTLPVSQGTLKDFFVWRRNPANAEAFEEAERFWSDAENVGERPAMLRAVEEATSRGYAPSRFGSLTRPLYLLAASVVLVLAVFAGVRGFAPGGTAFSTGVGEQRSVTLDDGSRLNLNTDSAVSVRFSAKERALVLNNGEALFNVAHDKARPFTVAAGGAVVTATGTQFNVLNRQNRVVVTLIEGRVNIRTPDGSIASLAAGEQWRWPVGGAHIQNVRTDNVTAWTQGRIVFDNAALADAVVEVNRYGGKPVVLDAPHLGSSRLSGSFQTGDSESFATAVTALLPLRQQPDSEGRIHLTAAVQQK